MGEREQSSHLSMGSVWDVRISLACRGPSGINIFARVGVGVPPWDISERPLTIGAPESGPLNQGLIIRGPGAPRAERWAALGLASLAAPPLGSASRRPPPSLPPSPAEFPSGSLAGGGGLSLSLLGSRERESLSEAFA